MLDEQIVLGVERLRDELVELKTQLRQRYGTPTSRVTSPDVRARAAKIAEKWMVDIAPRQDIQAIIDSDYMADLNVEFQRILTSSEMASRRSQYESSIGAVLRDFTLSMIIPLKQARSKAGEGQAGPPPSQPATILPEPFAPTAFLGHSFHPSDAKLSESVQVFLQALGVTVTTGMKPKASSISDKVKMLIEANYIFVGLFTRRDKLADKEEWTTSSWVIDEKAYAVGKNKKLILLREQGVGSIGGIQGDYEFIEFTRDAFPDALVKIAQVFQLTVAGLRA